MFGGLTDTAISAVKEIFDVPDESISYQLGNFGSPERTVRA